LPSFYSEFLIAGPSNQAQADKHDSILLGSEIAEKLQQQLDGEGDLRGPGGESKGDYQRGLGEMFGFPGDARKMRERSKMKLWREYFIGKRIDPRREASSSLGSPWQESHSYVLRKTRITQPPLML
jgi:hypothetical protein